MAVILNPSNINLIQSVELKTTDQVIQEASNNNIETIPLNLIDLYKYYGIKIIKEYMEKDISGVLELTNTGWIVRLNYWHHPKRQRFTLAHELGHYFLHRNKKNKFVDREYFYRTNNLRDQNEFTADSFAGELLMPKDVFSTQVESGNNTINGLSDFFNVSMYAVKVRAEKLGYRTN